MGYYKGSCFPLGRKTKCFPAKVRKYLSPRQASDLWTEQRFYLGFLNGKDSKRQKGKSPRLPALHHEVGASFVFQAVKNLPKQEAQVQSLEQEDPLQKGTATHSKILAWRTP